MTFDSKVPVELKEIQKWFASILVRPIDYNSKMMPISPRGVPMEEEAPLFIRPSPTLESHQRIELYNQQYWWRLLSIMQENTPLVTRLFGYTDFNHQIAEPYLVKYPPRHWSLNILSDRLVYWIEEDYMGDNRELVRDAAALDYAYLRSFFAPDHPPLNNSLDQISEETLFLQPHIFLFCFDCDLVTLRTEMMKEDPDYWVKNDFPEVAKQEKHYFVIYRNSAYNICVDRVSALDYEVLKLFQKGMSIDRFCDWIEAQEPNKSAQAEAELQRWFQTWTSRSWLTQTSGFETAR